MVQFETKSSASKKNRLLKSQKLLTKLSNYTNILINRILLTTKGRQRKGGGGGRIWIERWLKKVEKGGGLLEGAEKGLRDRS